MNIQDNYSIIMAGGAGTRLWPFSRQNYPKQFHDMLGTKRSFLQETIARLEGVCPRENIFVVTNADYLNLVKEQVPFLTEDQILLEPSKRNTAPCVAYATYKIAQKTAKANIVVLPADQVIDELDIFQQTLHTALEYASTHDALITLGIKPTRPDTGYGYIQYDTEDTESEIRKVIKFTEKPDLQYAKVFIASGDFVWNAGIFVAGLASMQEAMRTHIPDIAQLFEDAKKDFYTPNEGKAIQKAYSHCKDVSMDKGIMEKAENVYVILSSFGWSDLGTWKSVYDRAKKDVQGNSTISKNILTYDTQNSIIRAPKDKLVVVQGLKDYIVAEHDGVLMICHIDEEQRVREFVADAKEKGAKFV
jgi:mannose-1-phosphate guanylyltransferase